MLDDNIPNRGPAWTGYDLIKTAVAIFLSLAIVVRSYADGCAACSAEPPDVTRPGLVILNLALTFVLLFLVAKHSGTLGALRFRFAGRRQFRRLKSATCIPKNKLPLQ